MPLNLPARTSSVSRNKRNLTDDLSTSASQPTADTSHKRRNTLDAYFIHNPPLQSMLPDDKNLIVEDIPLNEVQKHIFQLVVDQAKNVFFTGAAGMPSPRL